MAVGLGVTAAAAATNGPYSDTIPTTQVPFASGSAGVPFLNITRFDPALGTLNSVTCTLSGTVSGSDAYENIGTAVAPSVVLNLSAQITVSRPAGGASLGVVLPLDTQTATNVPGFDGTEDFGGTSGHTYNGLTNTKTDTFTQTSAADLAIFTGTAGNPGTVALPVSSTGMSTESGNGNIDFKFRTNASATVTCSYDYKPNADLSIVKTVPALPSGGKAVYNLAVKDNGPQPTEGTVTINDTLPAGLTYDTTGTSGGGGFTCSAAGQAITCTSTTPIANGATVNVSIPVNVTAGFGASVSNTATVSDTAVVDGTASNNSSTVTTTAGGEDLTLTKSSPALRRGVNATYVLQAKNSGTVATTGTTTISDPLPAGLTYVSGTGTSWACTGTTTITCTYSGAQVAAGGLFPALNIVVTPTAAAGTSITNTATVGNTTESAAVTNNNGASSTATTVSPNVDLGITKTAGTINGGGAGVFTIAVKNNGPDTTGTSTSTVTDTLPAGLTFNATGSGGSGFACTAAGQTVTCTSTTALANGATVTFPINVTASATAASGTNTATVANPGDTTTGNNSSTVAYTVTPHTDLAIAKTVVTKTGGNLPNGGTGSYSLVVTNVSGPATSGTTTVTDTLPTGLTLISALGSGWTCTGTTTITCTSTAVVAAGAAFPTITLSVDVTAAVGASITNTASVANPNANDLVPGNNTDGDTTVVSRVNDLSVVKTSTGLTTGGTGSYSVAVANNGPSATAGTTTVTDVLPTGLTFVAAGSGGSGFTCTAAGQTVTCTDTAALSATYTGTITINVAVAAGQTTAETNTASIANNGGGTDPVSGNNSSTVSTTPVPHFDLGINKTGPATGTSGNGVSYTVAVSNAGPTATSGTTTVKDTLPAGLTFVSGTGTGWSCAAAGQVVTCTSTTVVNAGASFPTLTIAVSSLGTVSGSFTDSATVSSSVSGADQNPANDTDTAATTFTPSTDLSITKTASTLTAGAAGSYTLTVKNNGPSSTTGTTTVTDTLPAGLTFVSASGSGWTCTGTATVSCTSTAVIASGASYPAITINVTVSGTAATPLSNTATVANADDGNNANNSATISTPVAPSSDLQITKTSSAFVAGTQGTYTLVVKNLGPSAATGTTTVTDTLPAGLTLVSATGTGWTCTGTTTITCTSTTTEAVNASFPAITVTVAVSATQTAAEVNTATVANPGDTNAANNTGSVTTPVAVSTDLSIVKTGAGNLVAGQNGTYTLTVTNNGPSTTRGTTTVTDTLPAGLTFVSAAGTGFTCTGTTTVTCTSTSAVASGATFGVITLTVGVSPTQTAAISNTATVANGDDTVAGNNTSTSTRPVTVTTNLTATKTTTGLKAGAQGTYVITVTNTGPASTSGTTTITDPLPAGLTFVSATGSGWTCTGTTTVTCTTTAVVAAGSAFPPVTITVNVGTGTTGTSISNTATITSPNDPSANTANSTVTVGPSNDLSITKVANGTFVPGSAASYTVTVTDNGPSAVAGTTTVTDTLPAGLTFVSATGTGWTCTGTTTITCTSTATTASGAAFPAITVTVTVSATQTAAVVNTATVANPNDTNATNNSATATTPVSPSFDLVITKTGPATGVAGGPNVTYSLTIANNGPSSTSGTTSVSDTLPAGLTFAATPTGTGWTCTVNGQVVTCTTTAVVASGATFPVITVVASSTPTTTGLKTDTATVASSVAGANPANGDTSSVGTTFSTSTDLSLVKTVATALKAGQNGAYTLTVTNNGPSTTAGTTTVTDTLPAGLTFVSATGTGWTCTGTTTVTCTTTQAVASGAPLTPITLIVAVGAGTGGQTITNTATVASPNDANTANNSGSVAVTVPATFDLTVAKTSSAFVAGTNGTYTLTVTNSGPAASSGTTTVTDVLPTGLTLVSATGTGWTCTGTTTVTCTSTTAIASGATSVITLTVAVPANRTASYSNTATVANPGESDTTNDSSGAVTSPVTVNDDLSPAITGPATATAGTQVTYVITPTNNGPSTATGTTTETITLPAGLTYVSSTSTGFTCTVSGQTVTCTTTATVAPGATFPTITVVASASPTLTGTVTVSTTVSNPTDGNAANNTATTPTTFALSTDLSIVKTSSAFTAGQNGTYTLTVTNNGPSTTAGTTTVTDTLPAGLTFVSATGSGWTCTGTTTVSCTTSAAVASGAAFPAVTVTVAVAAGQTAAVTNTATVANANDKNAANNTGSVTTTPGSTVDLSLAKTGPAALTAGQNATYTLTVTNNGPSTSAGTVTVVDTLPAGLAYVAAGSGGNGWTCSATGQTVTCTNPAAIAAGATSSFPLVVAVSGSTAASVTNTATVSGGGDTTPANDTSAITETVTPVTDLALVKTVGTALRAGQNGTYLLTVTNNGPSATSGMTTVTDTLPAGLTYVAAGSGGSTWTCTVSGATVTCTTTQVVASGGTFSALTLVVAAGNGTGGASVANTATVANPNDPTAGNNSSTATQTIGAVFDLTLAKTGPASFTAGQGGAYTLTVTNAGPSASSGTTTVVDTLPAGETYVSGTGTGWTCTASGQVVTCTTTATAASGATYAPITITVTVASDRTADETNNATVSNPAESNTGNDGAQTTTPVVVSTDLSVTKTTSGLTAGATGTYLLTVTNNGPSTTTGATTVTDGVPVGLVPTAATGTGWTCTVSGQSVTCTSTGAIAPGSAFPVITLTVNVAPTLTGQVVNTTSVSNGNDRNGANNGGSATTTVVVSTDLSIVKTSSTLTAGQQGTYTLTVTNNGPSTTSGTTTVTDTLPAGATYVSAVGGNWTCSISGTTVTCTSQDTIATGSAYSPITITVAVAAGRTASLTNTATVASPNDTNAANNSSTVTSTPGQSVDLVLAKTGPASFTAGQNGTYTLTVTNNGPSTSTGTVTVVDTLPAGLTFVAAGSGGNGWTCAANGQTVTCTNPAAIGVGTTSSFPVVVAVSGTTGASVTNSATVSGGGDTTPANDTATVSTPVTPVDDLTTAVTGPATANAGSPVTYTVTPTNNGPSPTSGTTTVTITLPAGLTYVSSTSNGYTGGCTVSGQTVTCTTTAVVASGAAFPAITVTASTAPTLTGPVTISTTVANPNDSNANNNTASTPTTFALSTDLSISKTSSAFTAGQAATYTLTVTNNGPSTTSGTTTVTDPIPAGLTYTGYTGSGWSCTGTTTVTCTTTAAVTSGSAFPVLTLNVTVAAGQTAAVTNTATVANGNDKNAANNTGSATTTPGQSVDLTTTETGPASLPAGGTATYTDTVTNNGPSATSTTYTVTDTLPAGLTPTAATSPGFTCTISGQTVTCTSTTPLAAGTTSSPITITVAVAGAQTAPVTNTATVGYPGDTNALNNSSSVTTPVTVSDDISLTKTASALVAGTNGTYTLVVSNGGPATTRGTTTVSDTLPAGLTYVSYTGTGWSCATSGQTVTCSSTGAVAAGSAFPTLVLTVAVSPTQTAAEANTASVTNPDDTTPANNTSSISTPVTVRTDLSLTKTSTTLTAGTQGTYTLVVTNAGPSSTSGTTTVTDTLPAGLTLVSARGNGWTCTGTTTISCTTAAVVAAGSTFPAVTLVVAVAPDATAAITNTASVSSPNDPTPGNNAGSSTSTPLVSSDLTIAKTSPASFVAGANGTYTVTVTNNGPSATSGVITVTDSLPAGESFVSAGNGTWTCTANGATITCTTSAVLAASGAGASSSFPITVLVTPGRSTQLVNTATVANANDPTGTNNSGTATTQVTASTDLSIVKTGPATFVAGSAGSYTVTVTNNGPSTTRGVTMVTDTLAAGLTYVPGANGTGWSCSVSGQVVTCTTSSIVLAGAAFPTLTIGVTLDPAATGSVSNSATVSSPNDTNAGNNTSTAVVSTVTSSSDLSLTKTSSTLTLGQTNGTYTLTVTDNGPSSASGTTQVVDTLPSGITATAASGPGWGCTISTDGTTVTCTTTQVVAPNTTFPVITLTVTVDNSATSPVVNSATVTNPNDANAANNTGTVSTTLGAAADVSITKTGPASIVAGQGGTYSLTVTNAGPSATNGTTTVTDTLPAGLTYVAAGSGGAGWTCTVAGQTVTCTTTAAVTGAFPVITISVTAAATLTGSVSNTASVTTPGDPDTTNNTSAPVTTTVTTTTALTITKTAVATVTAGRTLTYTVAVGNNGPSTTNTPIVVTDTLPAGVTFVSETGGDFTCTGTTTITCTSSDTLAAGATLVLSIRTTVSPDQTADLTNSATVSGGSSGQAPVTSAPATTTVTQTNDLSITKAASGSFAVGTNGTYLLTVNNAGQSAAHGTVTVTDVLPAGLTFVSGSGGGFTCSVGADGVTVTCVTGATSTLEVNAPATITLVVAVGSKAAGAVVNTASVTGGSNDPNPNNNSSTTTTSVASGALGDTVFFDSNGNGIQDAGETGVDGVTVTLYAGGTSTVVATTTTASGGKYLFPGLAAGTYDVVFSGLQPGVGFTRAAAGNDRSLDSDPNPATGRANGFTVTNGQTNPDADAGLVRVDGSIAGSVFEDANNNGVKDGGEKAIGGVLVTLTGTNDLGQTVSLQVSTDPTTGAYTFGNLRPGTYTVTETQPNGYLDGTDAVGTAGGTLGNDVLSQITLAPTGTTATGYTFGELLPASIGNLVFGDVNGNGIQDNGDAGVDGVVVTLTGSDDRTATITPLTTTTANGGLYSFTGLRPGTYTVTFGTPPAGTTYTRTGQGTPATDSNADPVTGAAPAVTLIEGQNDPTIDAGLVQTTSLSGSVFVDSNNNGVRDAGETGIGSVSVTLTGTNDLGQTIAPVTVTTDPTTGAYSFTGLRPGTYTVAETQPAGFNDGKDAVGTSGGTAGNDVLSNVMVTTGSPATGYTFGELAYASIGDTVFFDRNGNGIFDTGDTAVTGVTVTLDGVDDLGATVHLVFAGGTDGNGKYLFTQLRPGTYHVTFSGLPTNRTFTQPNVGNDPTVDSDAALATGRTGDYTLTSGQTNLTVDAGLVRTAAISGTVFTDGNNDGVLNGTDTGLDGVTVTLTGTDDSGKAITPVVLLTSGGGLYSFTGLRPGTYTVTETQPTTRLDGKDTAGSAGGSAAVNDVVSGIVLSAAVATTSTGNTFAELLPASLGDLVFNDVNGNGIQDAGDAGVQGITVTVNGTDDLGTIKAITTTTDGNGRYSVTNLRPGTYTVTFSGLPAGTVFTQAGAGTDRSLDSDPNPATGTTGSYPLAAGDTNTTVDAGLVSTTGTISGSVFEDSDNNGVRSGTETGIAGVQVTLTGTALNGTPVSTTVFTVAGGGFTFTGLAPGTYTVTETQPGAYLDGKDSSPNGGTAGNDVVSSITLGTAGSVSGLAFGELKPASIGNLVFSDDNGNGIQDAGEAGIDGITVTLSGSNDLGAITPITTTTAGGGLYAFTGLRPGQYTVTFGTLPTGSAYTRTGAGTPATDSNANPVLGATYGAAPVDTLVEGEDDPTVDAGVITLSSLAGSVYVDSNDDGVRSQTETGIKAATVTLTGTNDLGQAVSLSTTTDATGAYSFTGLRPGTYVVTEPQPAGYLDGADAAGTAGGSLGTNRTSTVDTVSGVVLGSGVTATGYTFGELLGASLGDTVFFDSNGNGVQDSGEPGVAGVTATLTGTDDLGNAVTLTAPKTGADGKYLFTNLRPGTYHVTFTTTPTGDVFTRQNAGGDTATDSDADVTTGATGDDTLVSGETDLTVDAGLVATGTVSGTVFTDGNNDGLLDGTDTGLDGVTVTLTGTDDLGNAITPVVVVTAGGGLYSFTGLRPGTYAVTETQPTTRLDGKDKAGPDGGSTATNDVVSGIVLTPTTTSAPGNTFAELLGASIGDTVFFDTNGNGIQDAGDTFVSGVTATVTGTDDLGTKVSVTSAPTGTDGRYLVTGLRPGTYQVTFSTLPAGTGFTTARQGTDPAVDSDADPVTGTTGTYVLSAGQTNLTVDAGLVSRTNTISGSVFEDSNNNGVQDPGEKGVGGVRVTLTGTDLNGNPVPANTFVTTNAGGGWTFTGLAPGTYTVTETQPAGYLDGKDASTTGTVGNDTVTVIQLANGGAVSGITFGELLPATIGDLVFVDSNGNGVQDAGEVGLGGVTVTLTGTDDTTTPVTRTTTSSLTDGSYSFTNLRPGTYTVTFGALPVGEVYTRTGAGTPATDSNANPGTGAAAPVTLAEGQNDPTVDAGVEGLSSISGSVFTDANDDGVRQTGETGISGVTVTLTGTNDLGQAITAVVTKTAADGSYSFTGLRPGTYTVTETQPAGVNDGSDAAGTAGGTLGNDVVSTITLPTSTVATGYTFGELTYASIGDTVFFDTNGNGIQNAGEPGVAGVTVTLTGTDDLGAPVSLTFTTPTSGKYAFTQLRPGTYTVTFSTIPTGDVFTTQGAGTNRATDSDAAATGATAGQSAPVTLVAGQNDPDVDAGLVRTSTISGTVFTDQNNDGIQNNGDAGLDGVTVTLTGTDATGAAITPVVVTTTGGGLYSFTGLRPGTYTVTETQPATRLDGKDTAGPAGGSVAVNDVLSGIVLAATGTTAPGNTFAELLPATIGDTVFFDTNGNGVQDAGEPGVDGVTVTVSGTNDLGAFTATPVVTSGGGKYMVTGLRPGTYTVTFTTLPANTGFTVANVGNNDAADSDADPTTGTTAPYTLAAGQEDDTADAGLVGTTGVISGTVFEDGNDNGSLTTGEKGVAGVTVVLTGTDLNGKAVGPVTTTTNAGGGFTFTGLLPGTYTVTETQPSGYLEGGVQAGTGGGTTAPDAVTGITLGNQGSVTGVTFGELRPTSIGDTVFRDTNANGVRDAGEVGVAGVTVTLTGKDDTGKTVTAPSQVTGANGQYLFTGLRPGTYTVTFTTVPTGLPFTRQGVGADTTVDSNADPATGAASTTVTEGTPDLTIDAGLVATDGQITGVVFSDANNNGVKDPTETGVGGVTVVITGTNDLGAITPITVTTKPDGSFDVTGLRPGTYTVTETKPAGYLDGTTTPANGATASSTTTTTTISGVTVTDTGTTGSTTAAGTFGELLPATIGDTVFRDTNGNGVQDAGEPGVAGIKVTLDGTDDLGAVTEQTVTTAANGTYAFTGLRPGTYTVTFGNLPAGLGFTRQGAGTDRTKDSDANPAAGPTFGQTAPITLVAGQNDPDVDAGLVSVVGTISGVVVDDRNNNGVKDGAETGISGVKVTLTGTDDLGNPVGPVSVLTGADGSYTFTGLRPGTYTVTESTEPTGFLEGTSTAGTSGGVVGKTGGLDSVSGIVLGSSSAPVTGVTFGEVAPATIGDVVFADTNGNGIQDAGELGVGGVKITLTGSDDRGAVTPVTVTTSATGAYAFTGLRPGTYTVSVDTTTLPTGTALSPQGRGTDRTRDSDVDPLTTSATYGKSAPVTVTAGQNDVDVDAGVIPLGSISGTTFVDANGDGAKNNGDAGQVTTVTVTGTDDLGNQVSVTVQSNADGTFTVGGLRPSGPAGYTVTVTVPTGQVAGKPGAGTTGGTAGPNGTTTVSGIVLGAGQTPGGVTLPTIAPPGLSGVVFVDTNNDGIQDNGEVGIGGVTLLVTGTNDLGAKVSDTVTTKADGSYSDTALRPGTYTVTETQPAGYLDGTDTVGTAGGTTSGKSAGDTTAGIVLAPGTVAAGYTFGELPPSSLSGVVFADGNDNGVKDGTDAGIGGVTITVTGTDDRGTVTRTTTTAADGSYTIGDLRPGTYTLTETQPATYLDGTDAVGTVRTGTATTGTPDGSTGTKDTDTVTGIVLAAGATGSGYTFGEVAPGTITGVVFRDGNGDGSQDDGEPGIRNVTVTLTGTSDRGPVSVATTTGADGTYTFTDVRPGTYTVTYTDLPANTAPTQVTGMTGPSDNVATNVEGVVTTRPVTVTPGSTVTSVAGGLVGLSCIKGLVYDDVNGNGVRDAGEPGLPGVIVILDGVDIYGHPVKLTLTTDSNGEYSVCAVSPGDYTVTVGGVPSAPVLIDGNGNVTANVAPFGFQGGAGGKGTTNTTPPTVTSTLPFTGAETQSMVGLALELLGLGILMLVGAAAATRRATRRRTV